MSSNGRYKTITRLACGLIAVVLTFAVPLPSSDASAASPSSSIRVSFSTAGGKPVPARQTLNTGDAAEQPQDPSKTGYRFTGWYTTSKKTTLYNFSSEVLGNMTLYAGWEKLPRVTFASGGGKPAPKAQIVEPGQRLPELPVLTKKGYTFDGWYTDIKYTKAFLITEPITENVKIYAKWKKQPTVSFSAGGGKPAPAKQTVLTGSYITEPEEPTKTGYLFDGWYSDAKKTKAYNFNQPVESNIKLYAKWSPSPTVSFSTGGGKPVPQKQNIAPGGRADQPETPVKKGYSFEGWYSDSKHTQEFDFSSEVKGKTTVYAKWVRNPVVSFSTKGKAPSPSKQTLEPGGRATPPTVSAPEGYLLEGWYSDSGCNKRFYFETRLDKSITLYANWEKTE